MGAGVGVVPPLSSPPTCPFASNSVPVVGSEEVEAVRSEGFSGQKSGSGPVQRSAPGEGPMPRQLKRECRRPSPRPPAPI